MNQPSLLYRREGPVAWVTLNRPAARNALSAPLMTELQATLDAVARDGALRVLVLAGAGPAFCAGHDLREVQGLDRGGLTRLFDQCSRLMQSIVDLPIPVIARVHGVATAAGCQLVATCDLAIAAETARFATPGVNIGLFCSTPAVALTRAVGPKAAMEMLLTGELIDAAEAVRIGLINRAVPEAELDSAVASLARRIASRSPASIALGKPLVHRQAALTLAEAYTMASAAMVENMAEPDAAEGIDAFLTRREPVWDC